MSNEVTIIVKSKDKTDFKPYGKKARTEIGKSVDEGLNDVDKKSTDRFEQIGDHSGAAMGKSLEHHMNNWEKIWKTKLAQPLYDSFDQVTEHVDVTVKEKFREVGDHAGHSFGAGLKSKIGSIGDDVGPKFAGSLGKSAASAFEGIGAYGIAALVALVIAAAPAIGALLASGIVLAFGAGLAGLGMVAAFHFKSVQKEFKSFTRDFKSFAKDISRPFADTWKTLFDTARSVGKVFQGPLKNAMKEFIAPTVSRFIVNLGEALKKLEPAVKPASMAFSDLMDSIGPRLPDIFKSISDAIISMSNTISSNPDLFADLIVGMIQLVPLSMKVVAALARVFTWLADHKKGLEQIGKVFHALASPIGFAAVAFGTLKRWAADAWREVSKFKNTKIGKITLSAIDKASGIVRSVIKTVGRFVGKTIHLGESGAGAVSGAVGRVIGTIRRFAGKTVHIGQSGAASAINFVSRLISTIRRLVGKSVRVGANVFGLGSVRNLIGAIAGVASKTVNIVAHKFGFATGGIVGGLASGGMPRGQAGGGPGGSLTWVGEQGAELVRLPTGSQVYPAGQSRGMATRMGGGGVQRIELEWVGGNAGDELLTWIRKNVRARGGNVQKVFGR